MLRTAVPLIRRGYQTLQRYPGGPIGFAEDAGRAIGIASRHFGTVSRGIGTVAKGAVVAKALKDLHTGGVTNMKRSFRAIDMRHTKFRKIGGPSFALARRHRRVRRVRPRGFLRFRGRKRMVRSSRRGRLTSRFGIPTVSHLDLSAVIRINLVAAYTRSFIPNVRAPAQLFSFFKEFRLMRVVCSMRRRRPESTVFESASGGNTAAAARQETNDIFWIPWSTMDIPVQHPRQIRSARLLSSVWSTAIIRQTCIRTSIVNRPIQDLSTTTNTMITDPTWTNPQKLNGFLVQTNTRMPWLSVDKTFTTIGTQRQSNTGYVPAPGETFNLFDDTTIWCGFLYVDNRTAMLNDEVEVRVRAFWQYRGRKPLGGTSDTTGALNIQTPIGSALVTVDTRGQPSGNDPYDFTTIHVAGYSGPPDPGDTCFPCGPAPVYGVDPPVV